MKPFDNYEISPCRRYEEPGRPGKFYFEVCEPEEADVWTLYGHVNGEGVQAIGDFDTREHAEVVFQRITGIPFASTCEVRERLAVMHAGPKLLKALDRLATAVEDLDTATEGAKDLHDPVWGELLYAGHNARFTIFKVTGRAA